jgi:hypothetical protein
LAQPGGGGSGVGVGAVGGFAEPALVVKVINRIITTVILIIVKRGAVGFERVERVGRVGREVAPVAVHLHLRTPQQLSNQTTATTGRAQQRARKGRLMQTNTHACKI